MGRRQKERRGKKNKVTRQEIFYMVSLACLGLLILLGVYIWKSNAAYPVETGYIAGQTNAPAEQGKSELQSAQELEGGGSDTAPASVNQGTPATSGAATAVKPATPAAPSAVPGSSPPGATSAATPSAAQNQAPKTTPAAKNNVIVPGCKVGDIITLGDVEMVVTKATNTYKVIDITITGNTSGQPPKLVLVNQNRIIYEIPADVDINVDLTEKTATEKSSLFYGSENKN